MHSFSHNGGHRRKLRRKNINSLLLLRCSKVTSASPYRELAPTVPSLQAEQGVLLFFIALMGSITQKGHLVNDFSKCFLFSFKKHLLFQRNTESNEKKCLRCISHSGGKAPRSEFSDLQESGEIKSADAQPNQGKTSAFSFSNSLIGKALHFHRSMLSKAPEHMPPHLVSHLRGLPLSWL